MKQKLYMLKGHSPQKSSLEKSVKKQATFKMQLLP